MNIKTHLCKESERRTRPTPNIKASSAVTCPSVGQITTSLSRAAVFYIPGKESASKGRHIKKVVLF